MRQRGGADKTKDPFIITSSRALDRTLFYDVGLIPSDTRMDEAHDQDEPMLSQRSRTELDAEETLKAFVERIAGALLGIVALFAPVLIMIFVPSLVTSLATTFAFVLLVAAGIAWFTNFASDGVLGLSFAYAAVLVVFIGTSMASAS
ncbi:hypothetical protein LTR36_001984 [Oleoguttula mirabilis]|uniref:DUF6594 domain-containing protein n=1 Tax=Oleoguttula mirabilis TaxID=1507867 RepID=A0AAV9JLW0_9PEZI|nr:hypothetical protein LTR36_001984 [Oleoguttula mirabilis]